MSNIVKFQSGDEISFDAIVFATGYKSTANLWLKVTTIDFSPKLDCFLSKTCYIF